MKRLAIVQSNYIPWKGYFDLINSVDEFVLFDDVQYTKRDWRNRNIIKTTQGPQWLTIPVNSRSHHQQKIKEIKLADKSWQTKHWQTLYHAYGRAPFFHLYESDLKKIYAEEKFEFLSQVNRTFIEFINSNLGIKTKITWSMDYKYSGAEASSRLLSLCQAAQATHYLSGPTAKAYLCPEIFDEFGVVLEYFNYDEYPEYDQIHPPFNHFVSALDLLFNQGPNAKRYMKSFAEPVHLAAG